MGDNILDSSRALLPRSLQWLGLSDARQVCDLPATHPSFSLGLRPMPVKDRWD